MTVLVLESFAHERGATRGCTEEEAARARVSRLPGEVADALEAEHRIEGVERHHRHATRRVTGAGGDEARHAAGLGDALFEDLACARLRV